MSTKKTLLAIAILALILLFRKSADYPIFIENNYSNAIYPFLSNISRIIWGWIPFSIGDLFYLGIILGISYWGYSFLKNKKKFSFTLLYPILTSLGAIYLLFSILWGLNYNRITVSQKLKINNEYSQQELIIFTEKLITKINYIHLQITKDSTEIVMNPYSHQQVFDKTVNGYTTLGMQYDFLTFNNPSIKTSLLSYPLSYMGFSGYLNPFTNEAQVNSLVPMYNFPTTSCHEIAHQIGIGSESEANLVGHLASVKNSDLYFQYSGYTYALRYCLGELYDIDEALFEKYKSKINIGVWENFEQTEQFLREHESPVETVSKFIYGNYLEANHQKGGMKTYNNFVGLVINYYKNYDQSAQLF